MGNDYIEIKNGKVYVNDQLFQEYADLKCNNDFSKIVVPSDNLFVMGDNVNFSLDSRIDSFGNVNKGEIIGKVVVFDE